MKIFEFRLQVQSRDIQVQNLIYFEIVIIFGGISLWMFNNLFLNFIIVVVIFLIIIFFIFVILNILCFFFYIIVILVNKCIWNKYVVFKFILFKRKLNNIMLTLEGRYQGLIIIKVIRLEQKYKILGLILGFQTFSFYQII